MTTHGKSYTKPNVQFYEGIISIFLTIETSSFALNLLLCIWVMLNKLFSLFGFQVFFFKKNEDIGFHDPMASSRFHILCLKLLASMRSGAFSFVKI